jgi:hypothetical protein
MTRFVATTLIALACLAGPAAAEKMDCAKMLESTQSHIAKMKTSADKRAALSRMALSGYDSCMVGDMLNADKFFKMVMESGS